MNVLGNDKQNALKGGMPWGSNPKATMRYRKHVREQQMNGKKPLSASNWWNANRTAVASK